MLLELHGLGEKAVGDTGLKQVKLLTALIGKALRRRLPCSDYVSRKGCEGS